MSRRAARKYKLTELYVRKLKPAAAAFVVWDSHQRGLGLKVMPTGAMSWKAVYSRGGRPRWMHLGAADAIPLAGARELAATVMLAVARGGDPAAEKRAQRTSGTFADLAQRYLEQYAKRHNKSWAQADAIVRRHLLPVWGKLQASSITRADVKAMMTRAAAPIAANQTLAAASAIFTWANKEDLIADNPCRGVDRNPTTSRERVLSAAEVPKFWTAFDTAGLVASSALKMILLTGQRPGEVAHLRHEHIVDGGWWEMPGKPVPAAGWPGTKNGQSHRVWLPGPARALIEELGDEPGGFVFAGARPGRSIGKPDAAMRAVCKAIGADRATPHDLRRTHGTTIAALGFGRDAMNRIQNHRDSGIASVYDRHRYADEDKRIMEAVAARIMALAEGRSEDDKVIPIWR
jgi:integrase